MRVRHKECLWIGETVGQEFELDGVKWTPVKWEYGTAPVLVWTHRLEPIPPEFKELDGWLVIDKKTGKPAVDEPRILINGDSYIDTCYGRIPVRVIPRKEES